METLESLRFTNKIPVSLPRLISMKRQLWRLLDFRDGNSLGFTIELFFLALRGLQGRGVFSDFSYSDYPVYQLLKLELVQKMIDGHKGPRSHIDETIEELRNGNARNIRDAGLRELALNTIDRF